MANASFSLQPFVQDAVSYTDAFFFLYLNDLCAIAHKILFIIMIYNNNTKNNENNKSTNNTNLIILTQKAMQY